MKISQIKFLEFFYFQTFFWVSGVDNYFLFLPLDDFLSFSMARAFLPFLLHFVHLREPSRERVVQGYSRPDRAFPFSFSLERAIKGRHLSWTDSLDWNLIENNKFQVKENPDRDAKVTSKPISELCSIIWLVTFISIPFLLSTTAAPLLRSVEQERKRSKLRLRYNVQWSCVLARNLDLIFHFFFLLFFHGKEEKGSGRWKMKSVGLEVVCGLNFMAQTSILL